MKTYAVCVASCRAIKSKPQDGAEQLDQILFGDIVQIIKKLPRWTYIKHLDDNIQGWVCFKTLIELNQNFDNYIPPKEVVCTNIAFAQPIDTNKFTNYSPYEDGTPIILTMGTRLHNYNKLDSTFEVCNKKYYIDPTCVNINNNLTVCSVAKKLLKTPFIWGGKSIFGMDCSGFVQIVYRTIGKTIPRNTLGLATYGKPIMSLQQAQPGDIILFNHSIVDNNNTHISHCAIYLGNNKIIHCAGWVHISDIDETGINVEFYEKEYWYHIVKIIRIL